MSSSAASSSSANAPTVRKSPSPSDASEEMNRSPIVEEDGDEDEELDLTAEIEEEKTLAKQNGALNARAGISAADWKAMSASDRLDALLKQTTLFSQFVSGSTSKATKSEESGRGRRKAHSEKEEDENLVKEAETDLAQDDQITRLTVQPSSVKAEMRSYQLEALNWLIKLYDGGINGILADEMGLGKTLESLSMLAYLKQFRGIDGPHLVIVPKSTSSNWMREIGRFTPQLTAFKFHGTEEQRMEQKKQLGKTSICVTTYEIAIREKSALRKIDWQYLYIDEAHRIKNEKSLLASIVRTFNSKRRLLITGTPLQNNLHELWALLNFLLPQVFDSADDFAQWFNLEGDDRAAVVQRLHRILRPFILRRLKSEVEKSLPPKVETNLYIGLSALQRTWYTKILSREFHVISDVRGRKTALLNIVMQLRKVCNHPYLFDGAEPGPPYLEGEHLVENCGKMILLDKLLKRLKEKGHRVLIFSQMTRMLDILEDYSRYRGFEYCRIDGQTEQVVRDEMMDTFNAPNSSKFLFLLSTRAGGLGINLQTADTVILYDSDWNPQMDLQAQDRAHRIGQKRQVNVFRFITERTLEEKIVQRANEKLFLDAVVIQQGRLGEKSKVLSANELQEMVRFGATHIFQSKEATITDADIDAILAKGKERTEEEAAKLKKTVNFNNMNFTSDGFSVNEFEGKDYSALRAQQRLAAGFDFIELSKRERKGGTYDINKYYREALRVSEPKPGKKEWKPTARHDFQFFQAERIMELERREHDSKLKLKELVDAEKLREKEEKKAAYERAKEERKRKRHAAREEAAKAAAASDSADGGSKAPNGGDASSAAAPASSDSSAPASGSSSGSGSGKREAEDTEMTDAKPAAPSGDKAAKSGKDEDDSDSEKDEDMPPADDADDADEKDQSAEAVAKRAARDAKFAEFRVQAGCLTEDEIKEKEELLQEGFGNWNKRHFQLYLRACEKHGRGEIDKIKHDVEGKTPEEVEQYHVVFWKRGKELPDWSKYLSQIEKGEERLEKLEQLGTVLKLKYESKRDPFFALDVPYPLKTKQKTFTEEEDRFLICQMHLLGYGQWDEIRKAIRESWMFRFDWFLKSLKSPEIARRCEYLMKLLQTEYDAKMEEERAKRAAESKKKKAQARKQQKKTPAKGKAKSPAKGKKGKATPKGKQKKGTASRKRKSSDDEEEEDGEDGSDNGSEGAKSDEESAGSEQEDGSEAEDDDEEDVKPQKKKKQKTTPKGKGKGTPAKKKGKSTPAKKGRKAASDESDEESEASEEEEDEEQPAKKRKKPAKQTEPEDDSDDDMVLADLGKDPVATTKEEKETEKDKEVSDVASPPASTRKIPKKPEEKKKTLSKDAKPLTKAASSAGADTKSTDVKDEEKKEQKEEPKPAHVPKIPKKRAR